MKITPAFDAGYDAGIHSATVDYPAMVEGLPGLTTNPYRRYRQRLAFHDGYKHGFHSVTNQRRRADSRRQNT